MHRHPSKWRRLVASRPAACKGSPDTDPEVHYRRKDGTDFWASVFVSPVTDKNGDVVQNFVSFVDLTKHKRAQARDDMLINELNHRVKNTLAIVQSIVWQALHARQAARIDRADEFHVAGRHIDR